MDLQNNNINEVVVVEGYHDLAKLKSIFPNIEVIITNGSEIDNETLKELKLLNEKRGLILFLDPDFQGERIRRIINQYVGETKHAFLPKHLCISKNRKKVGIEHANKEHIIKALEEHKVSNNNKKLYNMNDLIYYQLMGDDNSKQRRKHLCEELGIGLSNSKTLLAKLNMFQIDKKTLEEVLKRWNQ